MKKKYIIHQDKSGWQGEEFETLDEAKSFLQQFFNVKLFYKKIDDIIYCYLSRSSSDVLAEIHKI